MNEKILKKADTETPLTQDDCLNILSSISYAEISPLIDIIYDRQKSRHSPVKLTSTIHLTNQCRVTPKCAYCGFAAGTSEHGYFTPFHKTESEIQEISKAIEQSGIPRVSCSGAHGYEGEQAVTAARIVKSATSLELLINVGADLTRSSLQKIAAFGVDTVCCNLETVNEPLFRTLKPGENPSDRIHVCQMTCDMGVELSSGLLIGVGESHQDRLNHLQFLQRYKNLGEIPIMGFNPYPGTPMENHPPCSLLEQLKTILVVRLMYPDVRITVPTPTIGPANVSYSLKAGANNIATVIPENYPANVKGVGSPVCGNLSDVLKIITDTGFSPQWNPNFPYQTWKNPDGVSVR